MSGIKPDYAFLELHEDLSFTGVKGLKPVSISREGIVDGQSYTIHAVSPFADAKDPNAVEKRVCRARYNSALAPFLDSRLDPIILFPDCPIGPSNSGAPVYNAQGELVALIGGQLNTHLVLGLTLVAQNSFEILPLNAVFTNAGWATNLACIPDPADLSNHLPRECDHDFARPTGMVRLSAEMSHGLTSAFSSEPMQDDHFEYVLERANAGGSHLWKIAQALMIRVPSCVKQANLQRSEIVSELKMSRLQMTPDWGLTSNVLPLKTVEVRFKFDPEAINATGEAELTVSPHPGVVLHKKKIGLCSVR